MPGSDAKAEVTLIEMLAVMLIIALVASLATIMVPGTGRAGLKAVVMETAALFRRERLAAILTRNDRHISLDGGRREFVNGGDKVAIPPDVVVDVLGADAAWSGRLAVVAFHADGASSGAVLKFIRERAQYEIRVNWYTGAVSIGTLIVSAGKRVSL